MATTHEDITVSRVQIPVPGTSVAADPAPFENTNTIEIYNRGATAIRFKTGVAGTTIADYQGITVAPGVAYRWPCGSAIYRPGARYDLVNRALIFDSDAPNLDVEVHYFNGSGSQSP